MCIASHVELVATQHHVGGPADCPSGDLAEHRLRTLPDLHEPLDVVVHELVVTHGVPGTFAGLRSLGPVRGLPADIVGFVAACAQVVTGSQRAAGAAQDNGGHVG